MFFKNMNEWFNENLLSLNFDKTYFMKFQTKNNSHNKMNITNKNKIISDTSNLKSHIVHKWCFIEIHFCFTNFFTAYYKLAVKQ
jgi:hypothetical protein